MDSLDQIPKDGGKFKVPEAYFDKLRAEILDATVQKFEPGTFTVPDGYFDKLKGDILGSVSKPVIIPFYRKGWFISGIGTIAAGLAIFFGLSLFEKQECESFACLLEKTELSPEDLTWIEAEYIEESYSEAFETNAGKDNDELIDYAISNDWNVEELIESTDIDEYEIEDYETDK